MLRRLAGKTLLICLLFSTNCYADTWLQQMSQPDKVGHYASGATVAAVCSIFLNPEAGLALTFLAAIGKEAYDAKHPATHRVERNDAIATALGGILVYASIKNDKLRVTYQGNTPILNYVVALK